MKKSLCIVFLSVVAQLSFAEEDAYCYVDSWSKEDKESAALNNCQEGDIMAINTFISPKTAAQLCKINTIKGSTAIICEYRGSIRVQSPDSVEEAWCNLGPISGNKKNLSSTLAGCKQGDILYIQVGARTNQLKAKLCKSGSIQGTIPVCEYRGGMRLKR